MSSSIVNDRPAKVNRPRTPLKARAMGDSTVARYHRVAALETVLSIRDRQQKSMWRLLACGFVLTGLFALAAGVLGWI